MPDLLVRRRRRAGSPALLFFVLFFSYSAGAQPVQPTVTLRFDQPGHAVAPQLYGLMTEEINYSYDGGLYGELVRNRAFRNNPTAPDNWSLVEEGGAKGRMELDHREPVNETLPVSLRLDAEKAGARVGVANEGYWGIPVRPKTSYSFSFYARASKAAPLSVSIESKDGTTVYAKAETPAIGSGWQQYRLPLTTEDGIVPSADTRLVISVKEAGTFWLSLVSLFPPTYHNTPNGNRADIMELLAAMKPAFLRFPGGNYLEGDYFSTRFDWKATVGGLEKRAGHPSPWGYRSTDGLGLYEFLKWCEDLKMEPLLAVFAGYTLKGDYFDDPRYLQPFIEDALDEIEYITGDVNTKWGVVRARDGHPAPFPLTYIEIGNEDGFDRSGSYGKRYKLFADAIRAKYPNLKLISTTGGKNDWLSARHPVPAANVDVVDEHFYRSAIEMEDMATLYDRHDRSGPKIFVGEWASREGFPTTNMNAALGDAAFLTGLERNSDLVIMSCYAPLFVNVNPGGMQWKSDLIGYNTLTSYGSPSYHVQKMFSNYLGDQTVGVEAKDLPTQVKKPNAKDSANGVQPKTIPALFFSATRDTKTGAVYLKVVNASPVAQDVKVALQGSGNVASQGTVVTLASEKPEDTNTIAEPNKIVPATSVVKGFGKNFRRSFPAWSVSVIQLQVK
jgi:alpha-N-arabinofuranosidase